MTEHGQPPVRWSLGVRRLITGEDGQILPLAGVMLLVMAALVFTVYNTGASVNRRLQTQQAADASAHSAAVWHARGLNLIAGNNRAATRVAGTIIALRAVDRTLDAAIIEVQDEKQKAAKKIADGIAAMDPIQTNQGRIELQQALNEEKIILAMRGGMSKPQIATLTADKTGTLWSTIQSLEYFSSAIAEYAVYAGQVRAMQTSRYNTEGEGIGMVLAPTWAAFPTDYVPTGFSGGGASAGRVPVVRGTFADFQNPVLRGIPPYPDTGRTGARTKGAPRISYPTIAQPTRAFFRTALPKSTNDADFWNRFSQEEQDKVFVNPGPQSWMPAPYLLAPAVRFPVAAAADGSDLRELGVWAAVGRRSLAPFWTHRFINQMPADLSTAFSRAKVCNSASWDLWNQNWQTKLTHADFTYDRLIDPGAVGPEQLSFNLTVMLDTGAFDRLYDDAIRVPGKPLPGGPIDPREIQAAKSWLQRLTRGDLLWDASAGQALITH